VRVEASVVKAGRALVVVEGRVTDGEGRLVAIADFSATLVPRRGPVDPVDPVGQGAE
jgi:acyl-coenzyme A thioesterase PaaI-like protein